MQEKRVLGISLYIIFMPIVVLLLIRAIMQLPNYHRLVLSVHPFRFLYDYTVFGGTWRTGLIRIVLYVLLGVGVSYCNNVARLGAIAVTAAVAIYGIIELIAVVTTITPVTYYYVLDTFGMDDAILPAMVHLLFIAANAIVVFYLTRPKIRSLFK